MAISSDALESHLPLAKFSFYLSGRVSCVKSLGGEIIEDLDRAFGETIEFALLTRAEMLFWFWLLGAYEIVRTMCHTSDCFDEHYVSELKLLKMKLELARMPAAKMEPRRKPIPVSSSRSPAEIQSDNRDLLVGNPDGETQSCRHLIISFERVICEIDSSQILKRHEDSSRWRKDA